MQCEWCRDDFEPFVHGGIWFCSETCRVRAGQYALIATDARLDGRDPPSRDEFKNRAERARKWTPERMQERIEEFTDA